VRWATSRGRSYPVNGSGGHDQQSHGSVADSGLVLGMTNPMNGINDAKRASINGCLNLKSMNNLASR